MKTKNLKIFLISLFFLFGIFSFFIFPNNKVRAQDELIINTTGYSILSPSSFVFGGAYENNIDKKNFTTYFEFKKGDSNLNNDVEKTIEIVRNKDIKEYGVFYTSPELNKFSTYYFRAVGYFNDNPDQKFYGTLLSMKTGETPPGLSIPFAVWREDSSVLCESGQFLNSAGVCESLVGLKFPSQDEKCVLPLTLDKSSNICVLPKVTLNPNELPDPKCKANEELSTIGEGHKICKEKTVTSTGTGTTSTNQSSVDPNTGLVVCIDDCNFDYLLKLITKIIDFILIDLALPLAAIMFAYAGFELVTSGGNSEKKGKAKKIFLNVAIGLIIVAGAWLIVNTVLSIVGYTGTNFLKN